MDTLKLGPVFFGALEHPDYAWPNYFYYHQQQSVWTKGIYLTTLDEVYHACIMRIQMRFNGLQVTMPRSGCGDSGNMAMYSNWFPSGSLK